MTGDTSVRHFEKDARTWTVPVRLELPNFGFFCIARGEGFVADELSSVRNMQDRRLIGMGNPGDHLQLHLEIQTQRRTLTNVVWTGESQVYERLTSSSFSVADYSPKVEGHAQDVDLVEDLLGWQPGETCNELKIFSLGGVCLCEIAYCSSMRVADVKDRIAHVTGKPRDALYLSAIDKSSLQLITMVMSEENETENLFPTSLNVNYVMDSKHRVTRLSNIRHTGEWDVEPLKSKGVRLRCHDGARIYTIQRTSGDCVGGGLMGRGTIDRSRRTVIARDSSNTNVAYASVMASNPSSMETIFLGQLRLDIALSIKDPSTKTLLVALGLVLAGADEEKWLKSKEIQWIGM